MVYGTLNAVGEGLDYLGIWPRSAKRSCAPTRISTRFKQAYGVHVLPPPPYPVQPSLQLRHYSPATRRPRKSAISAVLNLTHWPGRRPVAKRLASIWKKPPIERQARAAARTRGADTYKAAGCQQQALRGGALCEHQEVPCQLGFESLARRRGLPLESLIDREELKVRHRSIIARFRQPGGASLFRFPPRFSLDWAVRLACDRIRRL